MQTDSQQVVEVFGKDAYGHGGAIWWRCGAQSAQKAIMGQASIEQVTHCRLLHLRLRLE
jgi:hypothetical protein